MNEHRFKRHKFSLTVRKSPFKKIFMRWYDLAAVVFFTIFANLITKESHPEGFLAVLFRNIPLFLSALGFYYIHSKLNEKWQEASSGQFSDPISAYYGSFKKKDILELYAGLTLAIVFLAAFCFSS